MNFKFLLAIYFIGAQLFIFLSPSNVFGQTFDNTVLDLMMQETWEFLNAYKNQGATPSPPTPECARGACGMTSSDLAFRLQNVAGVKSVSVHQSSNLLGANKHCFLTVQFENGSSYIVDPSFNQFKNGGEGQFLSKNNPRLFNDLTTKGYAPLNQNNVSSYAEAMGRGDIPATPKKVTVSDFLKSTTEHDYDLTEMKQLREAAAKRAGGTPKGCTPPGAPKPPISTLAGRSTIKTGGGGGGSAGGVVETKAPTPCPGGWRFPRLIGGLVKTIDILGMIGLFLQGWEMSAEFMAENGISYDKSGNLVIDPETLESLRAIIEDRAAQLEAKKKIYDQFAKDKCEPIRLESLNKAIIAEESDIEKLLQNFLNKKLETSAISGPRKEVAAVMESVGVEKQNIAFVFSGKNLIEQINSSFKNELHVFSLANATFPSFAFLDDNQNLVFSSLRTVGSVAVTDENGRILLTGKEGDRSVYMTFDEVSSLVRAYPYAKVVFSNTLFSGEKFLRIAAALEPMGVFVSNMSEFINPDNFMNVLANYFYDAPSGYYKNTVIRNKTNRPLNLVLSTTANTRPELSLVDADGKFRISLGAGESMMFGVSPSVDVAGFIWEAVGRKGKFKAKIVEPIAATRASFSPAPRAKTTATFPTFTPQFRSDIQAAPVYSPPSPAFLPQTRLVPTSGGGLFKF